MGEFASPDETSAEESPDEPGREPPALTQVLTYKTLPRNRFEVLFAATENKHVLFQAYLIRRRCGGALSAEEASTELMGWGNSYGDGLRRLVQRFSWEDVLELLDYPWEAIEQVLLLSAQSADFPKVLEAVTKVVGEPSEDEAEPEAIGVGLGQRHSFATFSGQFS